MILTHVPSENLQQWKQWRVSYGKRTVTTLSLHPQNGTVESLRPDGTRGTYSSMARAIEVLLAETAQ